MDYLPVMFALLILSAFFSSAETAFLSLQRLQLEHYAREARPGAAAVVRLMETPGRLLSAILIGNNLVNTSAAIVGGLIAQRLVSGGGGAILAALTVTTLLVIFGEVIPKTIALRHNYRLSTSYALPMALWTGLTQPVAAALDLLSKAIIGMDQKSATEISEAELRTIIGLSAESGTLSQDEADLLRRVFSFRERRVHEVMVPRTEVVWVAMETTLREFLDRFLETPHSRFPVIDEDADHIVGIVGIKEVMRAMASGGLSDHVSVRSVAYNPYFVPKTKTLLELFREMQSGGHQLAIAIDEWGGTAGIVTLESLLEEVVGEVHDELQFVKKEEIRAIGREAFHVDGGLSVEEAREKLDLDIPDGPYVTLAGFFLSIAGRIPTKGDHIVLGDVDLAVVEMLGQKIELLRIVRRQATRKPEDGQGAPSS